MIKQCTKISTHMNFLALLDYVPQLHRLKYELHLMPWIIWQVLVPSRDPLQVYKWVDCPMACILTSFWRSALDFYLPPPPLSLGFWTLVEECKRRFPPWWLVPPQLSWLLGYFVIVYSFVSWSNHMLGHLRARLITSIYDRKLIYVTRNLSYVQSSTMIDLHCSFIDMGRLRRTCMLIVTSSRGFDALDVYRSRKAGSALSCRIIN